MGLDSAPIVSFASEVASGDLIFRPNPVRQHSVFVCRLRLLLRRYSRLVAFCRFFRLLGPRWDTSFCVWVRILYVCFGGCFLEGCA